MTASDIPIGVAAAIADSLMLSTSAIIQVIESRKVDARYGMHVSLLAKLVHRPRWVFATVLGYLGFPFEFVALSNAPVVIVQPVHAIGLLLLLGAGVQVLHEPLRRVDLAAVALIIGGVGLVTWGAPPGRERTVSVAMLGVAVGALLLVAFVPYLVRDRWSGKALIVGSAAVAFAAVNLAIKGFTDRVGAHSYLLAAAFLAAAAAGSLTASLSQMTAFQRHRAVEVVPVTFGIPVFLPVMISPLIFHENWNAAVLSGVPFGVGALLLLVGSSVIAASDPVTGMSQQHAPPAKRPARGPQESPAP